MKSKPRRWTNSHPHGPPQTWLPKRPGYRGRFPRLRATGEKAAAEQDIEALARSEGIRTRVIALTGDWWKHDGPPMYAETSDGKPIALIPKNGAYTAIDLPSNQTWIVDGKEANQISSKGLMFYPALPEQIKTGWAAIMFACRGHAREFRLVLAMSVIVGILALATPIFTGQLLAEVIPRGDTQMWAAFLGALLVSTLGVAMFQIVRAIAMLRIETRIDERLQSAIWIRLLSLPVGFFRKYTIGDLADRANGISQIRMLLTTSAVEGFVSGMFSLFSFALLFYYSISLAIIAGFLVVVLVGITWFFARYQIRHFRQAFELQGKVDGLVFQLLSGISKIRLANAESHVLLQWAEKFADQKRHILMARRWAAGQSVFSIMFFPLSMLVIFLMIVQIYMSGGVATGFGLAEFLSFNAAFGQFTISMIGLTTAITSVVAAAPLFERVKPILEAEPESFEDGLDPGDLSGAIEFVNVAFRYSQDAPNAVDGVSFRIRPGDYVAFVGASGSGKSTLLRLMLGFEKPDTGSVFLDGHDFADLDCSAVRRYMGVVLQSGRLIADSIFANIIGSAPLTLNDAWEAASAAGVADDIEKMPMGMHTVLQEGGAGLSGGQKQRLLIARSLIRKPRIILFDEATSALDNRTQATVQASLNSISATRVVIAHRLSTIQDADRIYVLEKGRIIEHGNYESLMNLDGKFAELARRQLV